MAQQKPLRRALVAVTVLAALLVSPQPATAAGFAVRSRAELLPGVEVSGLSGSGLSLNVGRVAKGAPVRVEVVAAGAVGGGVETTSAICKRVGGIICVNADFAECRTCTTALGGIVHDNVLDRSPVRDHPQLRLGPSGTGAGPLGWSASLEATITYLVPSPPLLGGLLPPPPPKRRVEKASLTIDAVNRARGTDQIALYTPAWGPTTRTANGGDEAVIGGAGPTVGGQVPLTLRTWKGDVGGNAVPTDGLVLSGDGAARARMRAFWNKAGDPAAATRTITLRTTTDRPAEESVGGHPVIMTSGKTVIGDSRDPFATNRHPRTLVGWNAAGDLLLATVDGRQPGFSQGVSLVEAADVLRQLGGTDGFNLDGGGSTTFVSLAPGGGTAPRVLNRPSDGNERRVTTVLAVVPLDPKAVRATGAAAAPPQPPPAPPGPPPPDEASTDGLPARPAATPAPTTTAPPTTVATTTTLPPPPVALEVLPEPALELAAPPAQERVAPDQPDSPPTGAPATVAAVALLGAATAVARRARRARRRP